MPWSRPCPFPERLDAAPTVAEATLPAPAPAPAPRGGSARQRLRAWWLSRLPLTDTWQLGQRNIYILPTKAGYAFAATLVVMLLAAINYQLNLGYALTFLLAVNVLLLVLGCLLEGTTILLIIVPVLLPTAQAIGIDPVHFGVVAVFNIMLGLITPPYGLLLFVMTRIAEVPLAALVRDTMPFLLVMIAALAAITLFPDLVLYLPRLLGYRN